MNKAAELPLLAYQNVDRHQHGFINRGIEMKNFSMTGIKLAHFALGLTLAATLAACGGGDDDATPAATIAVAAIAAVTLDSTTATTATAALTAVSTGFSFPAGVPAFGTTAATTVKFTAPPAGATTPDFSIAAGTGTATGKLSFGSCIFNIEASTIPGIVAPTTITVTPCAFDADTGGETVIEGGTTTFTTSSTLLLGTGTTSAPATVTVTVTNVNGVNTVTVNGGTLGTVTGTVVTGGGS
jgi:hypothetical protein